MTAIDLRSDTVTKPTDEMRRAMAAAEVGDDVFGEDPSINELQERSAALLGKEASLLTSSGTMSNLIATLAWSNKGDEIIMGGRGPYVLERERRAGGTGAACRRGWCPTMGRAA